MTTRLSHLPEELESYIYDFHRDLLHVELRNAVFEFNDRQVCKHTHWIYYTNIIIEIETLKTGVATIMGESVHLHEMYEDKVDDVLASYIWVAIGLRSLEILANLDRVHYS